MSLKYSKLGARQKESDIARLMTMALQRPDLLSLAAGFTDTDSLPLDEVAAVVAKLAEEGDRSPLQYGTNQGDADLREILAERISRQDGLSSKNGYRPDGFCVTNGSQQALYLAVQTLCDPGDIVLVEEPTYFVFLEMLRGLGVTAVSMPMDCQGDVDTQALEELLQGYEESGEISRIKAVYLVSYFANPSGHSVSRETKQAVVDMLDRREGRIALLEDAAYRELYYETPYPAESCLAASAGRSAPVFYTATLTKPFASGLKVGYGYCSDMDWLGRMLAVKGQQDFGTTNFCQTLLARAIGEGIFDRHLDKIRNSYQAKMNVLDEALRFELAAAGWIWERPLGGLYLWLTAPEGVETSFDSALYAACLEEGVMYVPGDLCSAEQKKGKTIRLSFGVLDHQSLREAARRFLAATRACSLKAIGS